MATRTGSWIFVLSVLGAKAEGVTADHKVVNHFYLLLTEHPQVHVTYQSDFMVNQELKFSLRKEKLLVYLFGDRPNELSRGNKEFILIWRPTGRSFEKSI
jgi:hypothetical protein